MKNALAYMLLETKHGHSQEVAKQLMKYEQIQNIHELFGQYDLILKVMCSDNHELSSFVHEVINVPAVERTETLVVSDVAKENCDQE